MRNLLLAVFVLACAFSAVAQNKHPFTFEDMMALKRVEEPVPSPDGKWVLFAAVDVDLKANTKTPHVWVVPIAGGERAGDHFRSGCGPATMGAGWKAVCLCFDQGEWIANLDRGFRWRDRDCDRPVQADVYCHRS